ELRRLDLGRQGCGAARRASPEEVTILREEPAATTAAATRGLRDQGDDQQNHQVPHDPISSIARRGKVRLSGGKGACFQGCRTGGKQLYNASHDVQIQHAVFFPHGGVADVENVLRFS
ncbi:MAG: hypothetical protein AAF961_08365, partial [Planctomycetota bacterium]